MLKSAAAVGLGVAAGAGRGRAQGASRPNVLLIIDDQHSPRYMGWTGESHVRTPCLDRLAAESVRFTGAYANSPVCGPTRHSIYTGLYASEHGVLTNDVPMREGLPTLMGLLNDAGYTTANVGKMHNCPYHLRQDFQYVLNHEFFIDAAGISHYHAFLKHELERRGIKPELAWGRPSEGKRNWLEDPQCIAGENPLPEDLTAERWVTEESLKFIRDQLVSRPDQPFFLHASYFPPHHPYRPIRKYAEMYDPADMPLPPNHDREKLDRWGSGPNRPGHLSDDELKRFIAFYSGFVTQLDAAVGRLLDGLGELGVADNTIVMFMSDHGDMMGEHGELYKGSMYEGSARVPFLVRWPGVSQSRDEASPMSHVDIMPTVLRAVGLEPDAHLPGADLRPLLAGGGDWPDRAVYSEFLPRLPFLHLMLRRGAYKLWATNGRGGEAQYRLFDVESDPWELRDLSKDGAHAATLESLKGELAEQWRAQERHMPSVMPKLPKRSGYKITWPADPWQPVEPA